MNAGVGTADPSDEILIRRFIRGDEQAFRELYRRHTPRLRMMVLRLLGYRDADADDVLQDTWLAGCRALPGFRGDARFDTWLTTIAIRTAKRRLARVLDAPEINETTIAQDGRADFAIVASASRGCVSGPDVAVDAERVLQRLSDRSRIVFTLHYLEGFSHEDIARELGIAAGTSRAILSRGLAQLRAHYAGVTHDD